MGSFSTAKTANVIERHRPNSHFFTHPRIVIFDFPGRSGAAEKFATSAIV